MGFSWCSGLHFLAGRLYERGRRFLKGRCAESLVHFNWRICLVLTSLAQRHFWYQFRNNALWSNGGTEACQNTALWIREKPRRLNGYWCPQELLTIFHLITDHKNSAVAYPKACTVPDTWCCRQMFRREVNAFPLESWEKLPRLNEFKLRRSRYWRRHLPITTQRRLHGITNLTRQGLQKATSSEEHGKSVCLPAGQRQQPPRAAGAQYDQDSSNQDSWLQTHLTWERLTTIREHWWKGEITSFICQ